MMIVYRIFTKPSLFLALSLLAACSPKPTATPATPSAIKENIQTLEAPLTLVHVWATWCQPCREEFPELLKAYRENRNAGLELILISADEPSAGKSVEAFLIEQKSPVSSLISTELSQAFIETLSPNWSGALPASFFFDSTGKLLIEWEGKQSHEHYTKTIEQLLKQPKGNAP